MIVPTRNHGSNVVVFIKANVQFEVMNTTTLISNRGHWPIMIQAKICVWCWLAIIRSGDYKVQSALKFRHVAF